MGEKRDAGRRRTPSLVGPVLLITAGVLFLLHNLDIVEVNLWDLLRLWPILIILGGLEILLGRRSALGSLIVLVLTVAVIGGVVILLVASPEVLKPSASGSGERISEPLEGIEQAELKVDFGAGTLSIDRLADSSSLVEGELDLATRSEPTWTIDRSGDRASMALGYREGVEFRSLSGDEWYLHLSPRAGFFLNVGLGAGSATLDLTGLDIRALKVEGGVGQTTVTFPAEGDFAAQVSSDVGSLILEIPEEMAVRLRIDRGLSTLSVPGRFKEDDQGYVTGDWATNEHRVDLELTIGVGAVTVREP